MVENLGVVKPTAFRDLREGSRTIGLNLTDCLNPKAATGFIIYDEQLSAMLIPGQGG